MSPPFPTTFTVWVAGFSERRDARKLKSLLSKAKKQKRLSEKEAWGAVAACAVVGCMNGSPHPGIPPKVISWAEEKGADRELLELAIEVLERVPLRYKVEVEYAIGLATIHAALASAKKSTADNTQEVDKQDDDIIPRGVTGKQLRDVSTTSNTATSKTPAPAQLVPSIQKPPEKGRHRRLSKVYCRASSLETGLPDNLETPETLIIEIDDCGVGVRWELVQNWLARHPDVTIHLRGPHSREGRLLAHVLAHFHSIRKLSIESSHLHTLAPLISFADLTHLTVIANDSPVSLHALGHLSHLSSLRISGKICDKEALADVPQLRHLAVQDGDLTLDDLNALPFRLETLSVGTTRLPASFSLKSLPNLTSLVLADLTLPSKLSMLYDLENLKHLVLYGLHQISSMSEIFSAQHLRILTIGFLHDLQDISAIANLQTLEQLAIRGLPKLDSLPSFQRLTSLKFLHLELLNQVRDFGPATLAPYLEEVIIGFASEQVRIESFLKFKEIPTIKRFILRNTYNEAVAQEVNRLVGLPSPDENAWEEAIGSLLK
jgi:hypothetical protein